MSTGLAATITTTLCLTRAMYYLPPERVLFPLGLLLEPRLGLLRPPPVTLTPGAEPSLPLVRSRRREPPRDETLRRWLPAPKKDGL